MARHQAPTSSLVLLGHPGTHKNICPLIAPIKLEAHKCVQKTFVFVYRTRSSEKSVSSQLSPLVSVANIQKLCLAKVGCKLVAF